MKKGIFVFEFSVFAVALAGSVVMLVNAVLAQSVWVGVLSILLLRLAKLLWYDEEYRPSLARRWRAISRKATYNFFHRFNSARRTVVR